MRTLVTIAGLGAVFYAALVLLVWRYQGRLVYYPTEPTRHLEATPADIGLDYSDVEFEASDGIALHGWLVAGRSPDTVLYFHGNAGNISHRLESIHNFHDLGLSVFIIDYRGYGRSDGSTDEHGTYLDARAAWDYLVQQRGIPPRHIIVFGRSLGGAIAAQLATETEPAGLILESTFTSIPDMARAAYPWLPSGLARIRYDTLARIANIRCPLLLLHSRDDELIPYTHAERLHTAAPRPTRLVTLRGGHNDAHDVSGPRYPTALRDFMDEVLDQNARR